MKILFIGLVYQEYTFKIIEELERRGHEVEFYSLKPRAFFDKLAMNIFPQLWKKRLSNSHDGIIRSSSMMCYDIVLFLQVHYMSKSHIHELKLSQQSARWILYNWDSINTHDYRPYLKFFDTIFSFDKRDSLELEINYLPLFATQEYRSVGSSQYDYDIYFVGNVVTKNRFLALLEFRNWCRKNNIRYKFHMKCSPILRFRMFFNGYLGVQGFKYYSLSLSETKLIMERSRCVFDFANHVQSGYTMRLIENMCAGKKIVTNNYLVRDEPWFHDDMFSIYKDGNPELKKFILENRVHKRIDLTDFYLESFITNLIGYE